MPNLTLHVADFLVGSSLGPLVRDAGVVVDERGVIHEVASTSAIDSPFDVRFDHMILMPGVINCHTHLTDAGIERPVGGGHGLVCWVGDLLARRGTNVREGPTLSDAVRSVLRTMADGGTVAVGEVANNFATLDAIAGSGMRCRFIHEFIAFVEDRADAVLAGALDDAAIAALPPGVCYTLAAHAPYSVSPRLMRLIADRDREMGTFLFEHLAEDPDERLLYESGTGPWPEFLKAIGAWEPGWVAPGVSPIPFYDAMGLLDDRFVAVHLADALEEELRLMALRGAHAVLSPASNIHITGKLPHLETIVRAGLRFGLGTDGRGSSPSVDVFDEARLLLERWPGLYPGAILRALTTNGAAILQFDDLGAIVPGLRPGLISIDADLDGDDLEAVERGIVIGGRRRVVFR